MKQPPPGTPAQILYIASRLPKLSETFVYRELRGLQSRGRQVLGASVREPAQFASDPDLAALARDTVVIYGPSTFAALPLALVRHPGAFIRAARDAFSSDHANLFSRLKHLFQAGMGTALGVRLQGRGIGHVHAHMAHVPTTIGLYAARALGARFSFTGHAADLFVERAALRFKLEQAAFVVCISLWHRQFYQSIVALDQQRLPVIRCSVALPELVDDRQLEVVTVARLVSKKGIDLLLTAFANASLPGWRLRIIGDGPERAALEMQAEKLGIMDRVRFEGARPHRDCLAAIAGAGMFVLPCRTAANGDQDGIPVVLMEAMAASTPVICGSLPTIGELVSDGENGLLVPPGDFGQLARAMERVAGDSAFARRLGIRARERVEVEFSDAINLDRLCAAFELAASDQQR